MQYSSYCNCGNSTLIEELIIMMRAVSYVHIYTKDGCGSYDAVLIKWQKTGIDEFTSRVIGTLRTKIQGWKHLQRVLAECSDKLQLPIITWGQPGVTCDGGTLCDKYPGSIIGKPVDLRETMMLISSDFAKDIPL